MSLRRKLLLICLLLLLLPAAAWYSSRQIEGFLRDAREAVLLATAAAVERALSPALPGPAGGLYVQLLQRPLQVDGYADDWSQWSAWRQRIEGRQGRFALTLQLAAYERWLYALLEVRDLTPDRGAMSPAGFSAGDHLLLQLLDGRGLNQYRLTPAAAGALDVAPVSESASASPPPVQGAWREQADAQGYRVELRLPASLLGDQLVLYAHDSGDGPGAGQRIGTPDADFGAHLVWRDEALSQELAQRLPGGHRGWLVDRAGWVIAASGQLESVVRQPAGGWQRLIYRLLVGGSLQPAVERNVRTDLKLAGAEINRARAGSPAVSWRRSGDNQVVASAAMPHGPLTLVLESRADGLLLATNRSARQIIGTAVLVVALVVLALLAYATILSLRVRRLRDAAEQMVDDDGADAVLLPGSDAGDEIGDLARSFSTLLEELRAYNGYLRSLADKLSHELNTPLAVVRSSLDNLADQPMDDAARTYAVRARDGADRLAATLRAMSEARRLEQSLAGAEPEQFDLAEVVRGCVAGYGDLDPGHHWQLHLPPQAPLFGSPELVAQMLDKLADNARSFCPPGGAIGITVQPLHAGWRLIFENDGPPLPQALGGRIFESLVSLRDHPGEGLHLGLGLRIVRLVARAHGGNVRGVNRPARGDGAAGVRFLISLKDMPTA